MNLAKCVGFGRRDVLVNPTNIAFVRVEPFDLSEVLTITFTGGARLALMETMESLAEKLAGHTQ